MRWTEPAGDVAGLGLPFRLALVDLLLRPMGPWGVRVAILGLAVAGLLWTRVLFAPAAWAAFAVLVAVRLVADWPLPDNHVYLLAYWCLGVAIALGLPATRQALVRTSRLLIGLSFTLAVLWKAVLSGDYLDGRFFRVTLLTDERFADPVRLIGGLSEEQLRENREYLKPLPEGAELLHGPHLVEPPAFRLLSAAATWGTLALEAAVAALFLWPRAGRIDALRHVVLLVFCVSTYAFAPVAGFGWLLVVMGLAVCRPEERRLRLAYVATFFMVLGYSEVPWAAMALGGRTGAGG